jgi:hypothetical protein
VQRILLILAAAILVAACVIGSLVYFSQPLFLPITPPGQVYGQGDPNRTVDTKLILSIFNNQPFG